MFCCLYKLKIKTGLELNQFEECSDECKYYKNGCSIMKNKFENVTNNKYDWMIDFIIYFEEPKISKSKTTQYVSIVTMIHPSHNDMWIIHTNKIGKQDEKIPHFTMHFGTSIKEFSELSELNKFLIINGYKGRKLTSKDFYINQNNEQII